MTPKRILFASAAILIPGLGLADVNETIGELPPGKAVIITHEVTVNASPSGTEVTSQGTVSGDNFSSVLTDDPDVGGGADPTVTPLKVNIPPTANPDTIARNPGSGIRIPHTDLLANDVDPDTGDNMGLSITGVTYTGGNGGSLIEDGLTVIYLPAFNYFGDDTFEYTVEDPEGASATGTVTVKAVQGDNGTNNITIDLRPGDRLTTAEITAAGIPGRAYRLQYNDTGMAPWFDVPMLPDVIADAQGRISFVDPGPLPLARIYRVINVQAVP